MKNKLKVVALSTLLLVPTATGTASASGFYIEEPNSVSNMSFKDSDNENVVEGIGGAIAGGGAGGVVGSVIGAGEAAIEAGYNLITKGKTGMTWDNVNDRVSKGRNAGTVIGAGIGFFLPEP